MPRKPTRHNPSSRHRPLTFSAFGRSMAMAILSKKARREIHEPKDLPTSSGNGCVNHGKDKMEESNSSDSEDFEGVVQADFVFFDPKPGDFHGVKVLLQTYLDNKLWDLSSFVDLILGQPTVGTVVKIENDEDDGVYSVVTALNLERYKDSKCVIELKDYLLKVCEDMDVIPKLRNLVGEHAKDVGLVVSQRVVNLPPQLLPPLYDALFDEIEWATEDEPTVELQNFFRFKFYLIMSKIYKHKNANGKKGMAESGEEAVIYMKPEDEIFLELSSWSFSFPLHAQQVTTNELKNYRLMGLVMVVEASKVSTFRKKFHLLVDE
ncbi:protein BCCIP homolog [Sesamum indicum]|uniref:Protein BCCIP homolog n=1 Tax=Sesamum indicum TaxID=4182 RepID=A0A6I9STR0_SESIN|nr:protein BCCIP homolog [Sesamum indicum]XP_011070608.1 protein BCCIP homolog [Sesamum indicum]